MGLDDKHLVRLCLASLSNRELNAFVGDLGSVMTSLDLIDSFIPLFVREQMYCINARCPV